MHVAIVSTFYYPRLHGGTEQTLKLHCEALVRRGFRVSVLSLHDGKEPERFTHHGVQCHALPAPNLGSCLTRPLRAPKASRALWHVLDVYNPMAGRLLEAELRRLRPDLVHTANLPGWSCAAWAAVRRCRLPHVQVLHDYQLTCPVATRFRNGKNCTQTCASCAPFARIRQRASQRVRHVVANSRFTRQVHQSLGFFAQAKVFDVIYGSVPGIAVPERAVGGDRLRIGYIGRLHPTKGIELLMDAFRLAGRTDAVLRVAGEGEPGYVAQLRERAAGANVEFAGHVPMVEFLPGIDVLVVPSLWNEPMGRVVIEAASAGVPVIAAMRGGIPELVKLGETGWLFDPERGDDLVDRLRAIDVRTVHAMRSACRAWGGEFSTEKTSARWARFYGQIAPEVPQLDLALSA